MKKLSFILALSLLIIAQADAQKCFQKGNVLLNPGIGLGSNYARNNGFNPSFFFSADFGVHDYVSVGPYVGSTFFGNRVNAVDFGARGNFHWWQLLDDKVNADLKQSQLELYATLWMGYELIMVRDFGSSGSFDIGFTQGLRWYPNSNNRFAIYGEFGYTPIAFATLGATIKIGK